MATSRCKHFHTLLNNICETNFGFKELRKNYSRYAPDFKIPVFQKSNLDEEIKKYSPEELQCIRIRAAEGHHTSSVFFDPDIAKFINYVMKCGQKEVARENVTQAFAHVKHIQLRKYYSETNETIKNEMLLNPTEIFHAAVKNATPSLTVTKIKKSGTWYNIPVGITPKRAKFLAMRWIIQVSNDKPQKKRFFVALAEELVSSAMNTGKAVQKKIELHKLCDTNRGYAHYKWT